MNTFSAKYTNTLDADLNRYWSSGEHDELDKIQ